MGQIFVSSTTDTPAQVDAAAGSSGDTLVQSAETPAESQEQGTEGVRTDSTTATKRPHDRDSFEALRDLPVNKPHVVSTTDSEKEIAEVQQDLDEHREEQKQEYLGRTRRKLLAQNDRLREDKDALLRRVQRLEQERPQPTTSDNGSQAAPDQVAGAPQLTREQLEQQLAEEMQALQIRAARPIWEQAARAKYADLDEVFAKTELPLWVINELSVHADGWDVGYAIAKNPEIRQAIMQAHQRADSTSGQEILNILNYTSTHLRLNPHSHQRQERARTGPPAPISPLGGASAARSTADPDRMSYADFKRWRDNGGGGGGRRR